MTRRVYHAEIEKGTWRCIVLTVPNAHQFQNLPLLSKFILRKTKNLSNLAGLSAFKSWQLQTWIVCHAP
jgi:hypothetical protein